MPRWTTLLAAPYRGVRAHDATSDGRRYRVQMHPFDETRLLLRLARPSAGDRCTLGQGDALEVVVGKTSRRTLSVAHVQHLPSWKGNTCTAIITF